MKDYSKITIEDLIKDGVGIGDIVSTAKRVEKEVHEAKEAAAKRKLTLEAARDRFVASWSDYLKALTGEVPTKEELDRFIESTIIPMERMYEYATTKERPKRGMRAAGAPVDEAMAKREYEFVNDLINALVYGK